jgi:hypothetical protein
VAATAEKKRTASDLEHVRVAAEEIVAVEVREGFGGIGDLERVGVPLQRGFVEAVLHG